MALPVSAHRSVIVELPGGALPIRGLSLAEYRRLQADDMDPDRADALAISWATGETEEACAAWCAQAHAGDLMALIKAIFAASGLTEGAQFPGGPVHDAGPARPGEPG